MKGQISVEYLSTVLIGIILVASLYGVYSLYLNEKIKRTRTTSELEILKSEINSICYEDIGTQRIIRIYIPYMDVETVKSEYEIGIKKGGQTFTVVTNCRINATGNFTGDLNLIKLIRKKDYVEVIIS